MTDTLQNLTRQQWADYLNEVAANLDQLRHEHSPGDKSKVAEFTGNAAQSLLRLSHALRQAKNFEEEVYPPADG